MSPRRPLAALAAASLLLLAGCSDGPFAPVGPLAGEHYALSAVNGAPLPAVLWEEPGGTRLEIVGETLEFRPFFRLERTRTVRYTSADGAAQTTTLRSATYYRVSTEPTTMSLLGLGVRIGGLAPCPPPLPNALSVACDPDEPAVVAGGTLHLTSVAYGAMSAMTLAMRFERYDPSDFVTAQRGGR